MTNLTEGEVTTTTVTLLWEQRESKPNYTYVVRHSNSSSSPETTRNTTHRFTGLTPGSSYTFSVITQTLDGTRAAPVFAFLYTRMTLHFLFKLEL